MILTRFNLAVVFGGPSAAREVSLWSGASVAKTLRALGHKVFEADLPERGDVMGRRNRELAVLEVNTLPGVTQAGLFPKVAAAARITLLQLCQRLIDPAVKRVAARARAPLLAARPATKASSRTTIQK